MEESKRVPPVPVGLSERLPEVVPRPNTSKPSSEGKQHSNRTSLRREEDDDETSIHRSEEDGNETALRSEEDGNEPSLRSEEDGNEPALRLEDDGYDGTLFGWVGDGLSEDTRELRQNPFDRLGRVVEIDQHFRELLQKMNDQVKMISTMTSDPVTPELPERACSPVQSCISNPGEKVISRVTNPTKTYSRVAANRTETFLAISHLAGETGAISLYSITDNSVIRLPEIHQLRGRVPRACQGIALDGKLYVLGGVQAAVNSNDNEAYVMDGVGSKEVYVLDLTGQRQRQERGQGQGQGQGQWQWKQCASMQGGRLRFACCVLDKNIYVFGGTSVLNPVLEGEVYDPQLNAWSTTKPSGKQRFDQQVGTMGGELYLYGGRTYYTGFAKRKAAKAAAAGRGRFQDPVTHRDVHLKNSYSLEDVDVYNPSSQEWTRIQPFRTLYRSSMNNEEKFHLALTKSYALATNDIHAYLGGPDCLNRTWTYRGSVVPPLPNVHQFSPPPPVVAIDNQIFAVAAWSGEDVHGTSQMSLLECHGFWGMEEIKWKKVDCSLSFHNYLDVPFMCRIDL